MHFLFSSFSPHPSEISVFSVTSVVKSFQPKHNYYKFMTIIKNERNAAIKKYIDSTFVQEDNDLLFIKKKAIDEKLPKMSITEHMGKFLCLMAKLQQPKRILEIGTCAGYSTLWFSKGAPDAEIITLENNPKHAAVARENFRNAKKEIHILEGEALSSLKQLTQAGNIFDLIFLDVFNADYPDYLPYILQLSRNGTILISDNLIPKEEAINNEDSPNLETSNTYIYNKLLTSNPNIDTFPIPCIVGENGRIDVVGVSIIKK